MNQEHVDNMWTSSHPGWGIYFLCQGPTVALKESGLTSIEFSKEQLHFFPFHVLFKSHRDGTDTSNSSSGEERRTSGFSLNWFLKDGNGTKVTEKLPVRSEDWKQETPTPAHENPLLLDMVQVARELRLKNMTKEDILVKVIHQKLQTNVMTEANMADEMCLMGQVRAEKQKLVFSNILSDEDTSKTSTYPSSEEIAEGYELLNALIFCPPMLLKAYKMIDLVLSVETSRTIIQTMVNLFRSEALTDEISFTMARQFYHVLADTLDLQYGKMLLATSTPAQMRAVIRNQWPFFTNYTEQVRNCLEESNCDTLQDVYQNLGKVICSSFLTLYNRYKRCLTRATFSYFSKLEILALYYRYKRCLTRAVPSTSPPNS